jgi:hypothetical protein
MNLQSARALKMEIASLSGTRGTKGGATGPVALGLAPTPRADQFNLAVRAPFPKDLSPKFLEDITEKARGEVDVRYTGDIIAGGAEPMPATRRVSIGASVGHYLGTAGTLGFFARRTSDGAHGIVSNNHVIAAGGRGRERDAILNPSLADGGTPDDVIALLDGSYPRLQGSTKNVDCAFARLVDGLAFDPAELAPGLRLVPGSMAEDEFEVAKVGRTTGLTRGQITAFELDYMPIRYGNQHVVRYRKQIEIDSLDSTAFSRAGDSGSLLFSQPGCRPIGLIYTSSPAGGAFGCGLTYAHPIDSVLTALGVTLLT